MNCCLLSNILKKARYLQEKVFVQLRFGKRVSLHRIRHPLTGAGGRTAYPLAGC
jgi:hypothetical protein